MSREVVVVENVLRVNDELAKMLRQTLTGKRIFRMAPLHHHFEMKGWSETKVMVRFWIITGIMAGLGFAIFFVQSVWRIRIR